MKNLIIIFIPIVVIGLVLTFSKGKIVDILSKPTTIYAGLILWTVLGFVFVLDNSMAWGCNGGLERTFSLENIFYSGLSVLFITIGFFSSHKKGAAILFVELAYWTIKLMTVKGGYVVGLGGAPDENILIFDSVALILRINLIQSRYNFGLARKIYLLPISFFVMTLKILLLK